MSIQKAQQWLHNHSDTLPAILQNHQKIIDLLEHEHKSQDIVRCVAADPGLSLALLKKINHSRGQNSGRDSVESIKSAVSLLGDQVTHSLLKEFIDAEKTLPDPQQLFLFQQIINRSYHNEIQVTEWSRELGYQHREALKTSALLNYSGEALCCVYDYETYLEYIKSGSVDGSEKALYGFLFSELTDALCQQLNLPDIIINSQEHNNNHGQKEKFLLLIAQLCHQAEHGWYTDIQQQTFRHLADLVQQPVEQISKKFHQFSILAARLSILPDAWQAASRLILTRDKAWTPPASTTKPVAQEKPQKESQKPPTVDKATTDESNQKTEPRTQKPGIQVNLKRLNRIIKQDSVTTSEVLKICINGLFDDLELSKVSLLLLTKDRKKLQNRMALGVQKSSPFQQYQVELANAGLLKILLNKPQSIWINKSSFKKYEKIIPQSLLASIMTTDFMAMSLFIGEKPIGIIYADRSESNNVITDKDFLQYKQLISLTSKALTFLSKK